MSSQFSTLMALSAMQTQQSQAAVQSALADRKRKEQQLRKEREVKEKKEKEIEDRLRIKHFEDKKRAEELALKRQAEKAAIEARIEAQKAAEREKILHGGKKAPSTSKSGGGGYPSVNGHTREELRKNRYPSDNDDDGPGLTRQEKRERKLQNDLKFGAGRSKRSTQMGGYHKSGRRLPGGAVDMMGDDSSQSQNSSQSVKSRLAAMPNTLTRLNTVKRDTRTIDEILRDREMQKEGKTLNGDQAKEFHDWFGKEKKKEVVLPKKPDLSASGSRSNTPGGYNSSASTSKSPVPNGSKRPLPSFNKDSKAPSSKSTTRPSASDNKSSRPKPSASTTKPSRSDYASNGPSRKRARSDSFSSDSTPPPHSRRRVEEDEQEPSYKAEIWKLFGKDRARYVSNIVDSDDEDMEADATAMEREELARFASVFFFPTTCLYLFFLVPASLVRKMKLPYVRRNYGRRRNAGRNQRRNDANLTGRFLVSFFRTGARSIFILLFCLLPRMFPQQDVNYFIQEQG